MDTRAPPPRPHASTVESGPAASSSETLEAFDWDFQPSLVLELARRDFVHRHDDLVITGKSGPGKSDVLKALGLRACVQGLSLRYARCVDLLGDPDAGLAGNTCASRLK
jgi:DNA replication protein DnaC